MDYETLLDDWVEDLLVEVRKLDEEIGKGKENSFRHGLNIGLRDGMMKAIVKLHIKEKRNNAKPTLESEGLTEEDLYNADDLIHPQLR